MIRRLPKYHRPRSRKFAIGLGIFLSLGLFDAHTQLISDAISGKAHPTAFSTFVGALSSQNADAASNTSKPAATPAALPGFDGSGGGNQYMALAQYMNAQRFGDAHWPALYQLWMHESGFNPNARNKSSGACGIPQALPCSKIPDMTPGGQIDWGLSYIKARYGNPSNAWRFWQSHHWY